jgi:hypothetical protein
MLNNHLGEWTPENTNEILASLWDLGNQLFPNQTAQIEDFVRTQATQYGITYAQRQLAAVQANPLTPILLIAIAFFIGSRKR